MSEKSTEGKEMSSVCEASVLLKQAAEPRPVGDSVKAAINRAARAVGLSPGRAEDIWYREARRIDAAEMDAIREAAAAQRTQAREAKNEYRQLIARISVLEERLAVSDEEFHGPTLDAQRETLRVARGVDRTVDS